MIIVNNRTKLEILCSSYISEIFFLHVPIYWTKMNKHLAQPRFFTDCQLLKGDKTWGLNKDHLLF